MKVLINKLTRGKKRYLIIYLVTLLVYIVTFAIFIKNIVNLSGIESFLRYSLLIFFFFYFIMYFISNLFIIIQKYTKTYIIVTLVTYIFIIGFVFSSVVISGLYKNILHFRDDNKVMYTSYLINMDNTEFNLNSRIGIIEDEEEIEGFILAKKLYEKENLSNELIYYEDYLEMLYDLYDGDIDAIFMPNNYIDLYREDEGFENIETETNIVFKFSEKSEAKQTSSSTKDFNDPMTFLILGVDSNKDGLNEQAGFNGDAIMLITFNPKTLNTTMLSLPRDIMVPIACRGNKVSRINSSTGSGTKCTVDTIESLTGINIDYYVKINFKGVVDLVDTLGGIEVDVEKPNHPTAKNKYNGRICEQDSNRSFSNLICFDTGLQKLDGEQALAYTRNRKLYINDLWRNKHQQQVLSAIANKVAELNTYSEFEQVLNTISKNMSINMEPKVMLSGYEVIKRIIKNKDEKTNIDVEKLQLEVYGLRVKVSEKGGALSVLGYYDDSLDEIIHAMKVNLELEKPKIIKTFSFSTEEEYTQHLPGKGKTSKQTSRILPSFVGKTQTDAEAFCTKENIKCTFELVAKDSQYFNVNYSKGKIGKQSVFAQKLLGTFNDIVFYINDEVHTPIPIEPTPEEIEEREEESTNED